MNPEIREIFKPKLTPPTANLTVTVDQEVIEALDAIKLAVGLNRSEVANTLLRHVIFGEKNGNTVDQVNPGRGPYLTRDRAKERNDKIMKEFAKGHSHKQIGKQFNLSPEYVRQIIKKNQEFLKK